MRRYIRDGSQNRTQLYRSNVSFDSLASPHGGDCSLRRRCRMSKRSVSTQEGCSAHATVFRINIAYLIKPFLNILIHMINILRIWKFRNKTCVFQKSKKLGIS